jgi:hypothetical protein
MKQFILLLTVCCLKFSLGSAQQANNHFLKNDSIMIITAQEYLGNKIGINFVEKHLKINSVDSIHGMITFLINTQGKKRMRNMIIVFVDGNKIDSIRTPKISKIDITRYYKGVISKHIFLNKTYAIELAEKIGFQKGIKPWSIKLSRFLDNILWEVENTQKEQLNKPYFASGKELNINARTGKYKKYDWTSIE